MAKTTMTEGTGWSLALTSLRRSPPRRACIPAASRKRTADSSPEPPFCADWPRAPAEDPCIDITTRGEAFALGHCSADLPTKHDETMIMKTDADPTEEETEIGVYEFISVGNMDLTTDHSEFQEDHQTRAFPTMAMLRARTAEGTTISKIGARAPKMTRRRTGRGTGRNLALTSPRPRRPRCA